MTQCLEKHPGPVIAATDYMKVFADQIRPFMPKGREFRVLGTDGFGRSDTRAQLRHFFEVNRYFTAIAALKALADAGEGKPKDGCRGDQEIRHRPGQAGPDQSLKDMAALTEVLVPDIGDYKDVEVIEVLVAPGDRVTAEQSLITLESDKASMEIPSPVAGVVKELKVKLGDKLSKGSLVLMLEPSGDVAPAAAAAPARPAPAPAACPPQLHRHRR